MIADWHGSVTDLPLWVRVIMGFSNALAGIQLEFQMSRVPVYRAGETNMDVRRRRIHLYQ